MQDRFQNHIYEHFPELLERSFLVACSGGLDSVVLAWLCSRSGMSFGLAHCNFSLRGNESEEDQKFVKHLASDLQVPFFVTHFDTLGYVNKNKVSVQIAARELRYQWFNELLETKEYDFMATAHHLDDSLETFIINLSRGTGIDGLTGIPEKINKIVRPLLPFSRDEILAFAEDQGISWREDSSNEEIKYLRNKIRHQIVPPLKELHPTFLENFKTTQHYLEDTALMLQNHIKSVIDELFVPYQNGYKIETISLIALQPTDAYLHAIFSEYGFTAWGDILDLLTAMSGKEIRSRTHRLIKDRKYLLLQEIQDSDRTDDEINIAEELAEPPVNLKIESVQDIEEKNNTILYVDKETLNHKLTVRKWKKGDYFYPLGMDGKKKVAKFFKDEKMDTVAKENQWILCCGEKIVWIIGRRADDRFKITSKTKKILKVTVEE